MVRGTICSMPGKPYANITLAGALIVLFMMLALSISSLFESINPELTETMSISQEGTLGIVTPPESETGTLPMTEETLATGTTLPSKQISKPLVNWPEGLKPLENYVLNGEFAMQDSYRWGLEIQGDVNIITGAIVEDMRDQGWEVDILYSYLGIEILGTYKESKMSLFVDTLFTAEDNWSPMTVIYQKAPIPYISPATTVPDAPSSRS